MAMVGHLPVTSIEVAEIMKISVHQAAPVRDEVIRKGMAYSPSRGLITFSVPKFEEYLKRIILNPS
jgi:cysteinyl-tRNA synthetase